MRIHRHFLHAYEHSKGWKHRLPRSDWSLSEVADWLSSLASYTLMFTAKWLFFANTARLSKNKCSLCRVYTNHSIYETSISYDARTRSGLFVLQGCHKPQTYFQWVSLFINTRSQHGKLAMTDTPFQQISDLRTCRRAKPSVKTSLHHWTSTACHRVNTNCMVGVGGVVGGATNIATVDELGVTSKWFRKYEIKCVIYLFVLFK